MIAVVFPGQGSQAPGMGKELFDALPEARDAFGRVSRAVGFDVASLCFEANDETLRQTQNSQIALFATGLAAFSAFTSKLTGLQRSRIVAMAGHSVGEYTALTAAGVYTLEEGAQLVQTRGRLMAEAGRTLPGEMAAVLALSRDLLEQACRDAGGIVVIANDNCPGQLVISGEPESVRRAAELAKALGARRVVPLNVSGAFHSPLMEGPAVEMAKALDAVVPRSPWVDVYSNVSASVISDSSHWPSLLERQLKSPVRWTETVEHLRRDGVTLFVECGWGDVLTGLIRRTDKESNVVKVADLASLETAVRATRELVGEA
jgi:[acyl-carrier-protein] S-malonyltransferase